MQKAADIYGTLRDSKPYFIIDSPNLEASGNLNVLQNLDVCGNITFNNTDLSSTLANLVVDLTGGQDASFTNVEISGSLLFKGIDISDRLTNIDSSLVALGSGGGGGGLDTITLTLNQTWDISPYSFPWQAGSRLGPEMTSNPYDVIYPAAGLPSWITIGTDNLLTVQTDGYYKFEINQSTRWYSGLSYTRVHFYVIRNGYTLSNFNTSGQTGYDLVHAQINHPRTPDTVNDTGSYIYDWSFPEHHMFTTHMYSGDRMLQAHYRNIEGGTVYGLYNFYWNYQLSVTRLP